MDISNEKRLTSFGLLFSLLGNLIPFIGSVVSLGGFIAYALGIYNFSKKFNNGDIFKNFIYSILVLIVGVVVFFILAGSSLIPLFTGSQSAGNLSFGLLIFSLFIFWLFSILSAFFTKKYFDIFYEYTKEDLFRYAGIGVLVGSVLLVLSIIGWIIAIIAFFRMPDNLSSSQASVEINKS